MPYLFAKFSASYFWYFAVIGLMIPYLPVFLDGRGFNSLEIGELVAIFTATKIFGPPLWAVFADKSGQQLPIIRLGALLAVTCFIALFYFDSYWGIAFSLAAFSLFWTAILPQMEVMTLTSIRKSAKIYGRIRLWGSVGFTITALVCGQIVSVYGSDTVLMCGFVILLSLFLSTLLLKQLKKPAVSTHKQNSASILSRILTPSFIIFFVAGLLLQVSFGPYYSFLALYLRDLSYPDYLVGVLTGFAVVAEIVVFIYVGRLFRYFSVKQLLVFSFLITAVRWWVMADFGQHLLLLFVVQLAHAAGFGLYHSASMQYLQEHFAVDQQNRGQAIYISGVWGVGGAAGAYLAGILWADGSGASAAFYFAATASLIAGLLAMLLPKPKIAVQ